MAPYRAIPRDYLSDTPLLRAMRFFRGRHGGVEKGGGRKTSRMTPLPKRGFWTPPPVRYVFHPPRVSLLCFSGRKNPRLSRPEVLLEGSRIFREGAFTGTFSSPHTFCTPPYQGPSFGVSTWPIGCNTPSPFSEHFLGENAKWRCDTPATKGVPQRYLRDTT